MELKYPLVIVVGIIILICFIFVKPKKMDTYKEGKKVANTKYIKELSYYQGLIKKYKMWSALIKSICIIAIIGALVLLARPITIDTQTQEQYNRDIFLCMDVSASVNELNEEIVKSLKEVVQGLKGERFGITIFNTSSVLLVPLTDDYDYVLETLDTLEKSFGANNNFDISRDTYSLRKYIISGTVVGAETRGSSIPGDGLASCIYNFPNLEEERTRVILFTTDNELAGEPIVTLDEAAQISQDRNVTVYAIAPHTIQDDDKEELKTAIEKTGGEYYTEDSTSTVDSIIENIEQKEKSLIKGAKETREIDQPLIPFIIILVSVIILCILSKKVKV